MAGKGLNKAESEILDRILSRVDTHVPPSGANINDVYNSWNSQNGRDYIEALYRPKPIGALLSDDLIITRQWFLVTYPKVVTDEDAIDLVRRAQSSAKLADFVVEDRKDFFGLSLRQPTRAARFVRERLAPQLDDSAVACTADMLIAHAALQDARQNLSLWPPSYINPDQRHCIEIELVLLADSSKSFTWHRERNGALVFRSATLATAMQGGHAQPKKADDKLAAAEKKIRQLTEEVKRLESSPNESELIGRFKRVYREHVLNYHPDKLTSRPEVDRRVGEEVTRVLNALYRDIKL